MKHFLSKYSRPALTAVLVLALTMVMSIGSAFAVVSTSDKYYITDQADVISENTENHIVNTNGYLEANCSGAQIGVVVVHWLDGMDIEDYCYKLFDQMQLGDADEDNGLLLLLTTAEENYWCMQGKGLENELTSSEIDDILWYYLEDDFAVADYDEGVVNTFNIFVEEICDIYGVPYPDTLDTTSENYYDKVDYSDEPLTFKDWLIFLGFCAFLLFVMIYLYTSIKKMFRKIFGGDKSAAGVGPTPHSTVRRTVRRRPRPIIFMGTGGRPPHRPHHHVGHYGHGHGHPRPSSRPTSGPSASRPTSRPTSRPSVSRPVSRPSRPSGGGGGGMSRGGGAGRRGR